MEPLYIVQKAEENKYFANTNIFKQYTLARKTVLRYIKSKNTRYQNRTHISGNNNEPNYFREISPDYWTDGGETIRIVLMKRADIEST